MHKLWRICDVATVKDLEAKIREYVSENGVKKTTLKSHAIRFIKTMSTVEMILLVKHFSFYDADHYGGYDNLTEKDMEEIIFLSDFKNTIKCKIEKIVDTVLNI